MGSHRSQLFLITAIILFFRIDICHTGSRVIPKTPARILAERTGAAHFEEHYEKIESSEDKQHHIRKRASDEDDFDYEVYQGVVGRPGIDFPVLPRIPQTTFSCRTYGNGYFADLETECQVFHICDDGRKISFLCPNGTIFQQTELICDWWFKVNCASSPGHYSESSELLLRTQNRKSRPSYKKQSNQNNYYDTDEYSDSRRPSPKIKTEFSVKSHRKNEGPQHHYQKRKDSKRVDSDEIPSVENFDFDDSTETVSLTNNSKEKLISRVESNDAEMQDFAESASFVGNGQRRNGYIYNSPSEDKKNFRENGAQKSYEKTKTTDRGRQRYNSDSTYKTTTKTVTPDSSKDSVSRNEKLKKLTTKSDISSQDQTLRNLENRQDRKQSTDRKSNLITQSDGKRTTQLMSTRNRPNTYTTARKLDATRTTPYYTPTVPTVLQNKFTKSEDEVTQDDKKYQYSTTRFTNKENGKSADYSAAKNNSTTTVSYEAEIISTTPEYRTTLSTSYGRRVSPQSSPLKDNTETTHRSSDSTQHTGYEYTVGRTTQSTFIPQSQESPKSTTLSSSDRSTASRTQNGFFGSKYEVQNLFKSKTNSFDSEKKIKGENFDKNENLSKGSGQNKQNSSSSDSGQTTPKPLVVGLRGTLSTDTTLPSNITSRFSITNGQYTSSFTKSNSNYRVSSATISPQSSSTESTNLPTATTTPLHSSSSGPTYLPKETTTLRPSSSGPTYIPKPTKSSLGEKDVTEHVQEMVKTINGLKKDLNVDTESLNKDANKYLGKTRPGLEIPPSSGPQTLHSLALYFAGEEENAVTTDNEATSVPTTKTTSVIANISAGLLSNKTVTKYERLFGLETTERPTESTLPPDFRADFVPDNNDLEAQHSNGPLGDSIGKPQTRKIAQVFTNALSAYLEDPDSFRRTLAEIRPTEPSLVKNNSESGKSTTTTSLFNRGTGASYLPTTATTISPTTMIEESEDDLEFSDGSHQKNSRKNDIGTTEFPSTKLSRTNIKGADKTRASRLITEQAEKNHKYIGKQELTTTEPNEIAMEINKGLSMSTPSPIFTSSRQPKRIGFTSRGTTDFNGATVGTPPPLINFDLLPPIGSTATLSSQILPPALDEDEESLLRAQSQSFAASKNELNKELRNKFGKAQSQIVPTTHRPRSSLIKRVSTTEIPDTGKYSPNPWSSLAYTVFLDPLTINDGLMNDLKTTTASPFTYLPKSTMTTTDPSTTHFEFNNKEVIANRLGKAYPDISEELLPPKDGMQKIANKMFGTLNESSADHLMNVMKKAESNQTVRRLILLLIQTCDEDYNNTVEQSRQALLNALIGMDQKLALEDEIEVIKLKPNRRGKSISPSNEGPNEIYHTTTDVPATTYRRNFGLKLTTTTTSPKLWTTSTIEPTLSTTHLNSVEDTTRFEIRVEETDDSQQSTTTTNSPTRNYETKSDNISSTTLDTPTTSINYSTTTTIPPSPTNDPNLNTTIQPNLRRKPKDLDSLLSQPNINTDYSSSSSSSSTHLRHKNSDERALELLKSLYSLASKFGRR